MALDFIPRDVMHKITAKFVPAYLPGAKKPYHLRAVYQPELDIHELASKAETYNITTDPKVIEDGMNAGFELMYYLLADGYKVKTPAFTARMRLPGEYEGDEPGLAEGEKPELRLQTAAPLRRYIAEKVEVQLDGLYTGDGLIAEARDEKTGHVDDVVTIGNILTIHGYGLKVEGDAAHPAVGVFFQPESGVPTKAEVIAVNENKTIKLVVPSSLAAGTEYYLRIFTMSSAHHVSTLLKEVRDMKSEFRLTAQT